ncbi:hypothetical protein [Arthrobacter sp. D2-10]
MVLWLFTYIFMGMAPYVQQRLQIEPSTTPNLEEYYFIPAAALVVVCSIAVMAGSFVRGQKLGGVQFQAPTVRPDRANLLALLAVVLFVYVGTRVGFGAFIGNRTDYSLARAMAWPEASVNSLITGALNMSLLVAFIAQMHVREQRRQDGLRPPLLRPLLTAVVLLYCVNPVSSPRYVFGTVALAMLATLGAYATLTRFRFVSIAAIVGVVTIFPLADMFRHSTKTGGETGNLITALTTGDFDAFAQLVNSFQYVDSHGITWGQQLLGVLLFWVPRSIWPGKPVDTGILLAEYKGYGFTNLSSPIWSELFVNGGWVFSVGGMFFIGYWFRHMDQKAEQSLQNKRIPPVLVCIVPFYLLIVLRGSLLNAVSYLLVIVLCAWFVTQSQPLRPAESLHTAGRQRIKPRSAYSNRSSVR